MDHEIAFSVVELQPECLELCPNAQDCESFIAQSEVTKLAGQVVAFGNSQIRNTRMICEGPTERRFRRPVCNAIVQAFIERDE